MNLTLRPNLIALLAVACVGVACSEPPVGPEPLHDEPGPLKAGAGQAVIQLPVGHSMGGYAQSPHMGAPQPVDDPSSPYTGIFASTRGMQSAPAAKIIVIENGHSRLFLGRIDAIGMTEILVERVTRMAKEKLGEDVAGQLILSATHTHDAGSRFLKYSVAVDMLDFEDERRNALAHGFDIYSQESTDRVASAVVEAMRQALATEKPAKFGYGKGDTRLASRDRRCANDYLYGEKFFDSEVTVVRLDDATSGDPIAVLFNYPMHGIFYDFGNFHLSVDGPGHAEYKLEEMFEKPVVAMYMQGSAGDVSPEGGGSEGSQGMQHAGFMLAQKVKEVYDSIETIDVAPVQVRQRWIPISREILGYAKGEFFEDGVGLCFQLFGGVCVKPGEEGFSVKPSDVIDPVQNLCLAKVFPGEGKYHTLMATARIGDLAFMSLPGEPLSAVGIEMKKRGKELGFKDVFVLGYAQDHNGYIMFDQDWLSAGYEPTISFWGWKFGSYVVDQVTDLLQEMKTGQAPKKRKEAVKIPDLAPEQYTPIVPSNSSQAPAVVLDVPAEAERTDAVRFAFYGGDPGLGHPEVRLQKKGDDGSFTDVLRNGWLPVSNLRGYDFALFYTVAPTYKKDPGASAREHRWEYVYEVPIDLEAGTYRFHFTGTARMNGSEQAIDLTTGGFEVKPSTKLSFDTKIEVKDGKIVLDATALYPQEEAKNIDGKWPFDMWQIENFRLHVPRYSGHFAPVQEAQTPGKATGFIPGNGGGEGTTVEVPFTFRTPAVDEKLQRYGPGEGPGLHGEWTIGGSGTPSELIIAAGAFVDAWGNTNVETKVTVPGSK